MRILLLSDIHANLVALETVLHAARHYDAIWCLGDVVGYGPQPNECVARLRASDTITLTGNHDQAALGNVPLEQFRTTARLALEWTRETLTAENSEWLAARPTHTVLQEFGVTLTHGSPRHPVWEYIDNTRTALENFAHFDTAFCFFGHTHLPIAYRLDLEKRALSAQALEDRHKIQLEPKTLVNIGSVGQPRDGDARAAYAIYDTDTYILVPHRVKYDFAKTQRAMTEVGLPEQLISRLEHGV